MSRFGETAFLAILRNGMGVFVDHEEAPGEFRMMGPVGATVHFHATAAGKAIAAFLPEETRAAILRQEPLAALTPLTLTRPLDIERDWEKVRRDGYALNDEETIIGAVFLAAPVFDSRQQVCASISLGFPKARGTGDLTEAIAVHLKDACRRFSDMLRATGYVQITGTTRVNILEVEPISQGRQL
jgi:IclR family acetate operon transcriptional repressor